LEDERGKQTAEDGLEFHNRFGCALVANGNRRKGFREFLETLSIAPAQGAVVYKPPNESSLRVEPRKETAVWTAPLLGPELLNVVDLDQGDAGPSCGRIGLSPVAKESVTRLQGMSENVERCRDPRSGGLQTAERIQLAPGTAKETAVWTAPLLGRELLKL
jgi:hypothetical protein